MKEGWRQSRRQKVARIQVAMTAISGRRNLSSNEFGRNLFFAIRSLIESYESYVREYRNGIPDYLSEDTKREIWGARGWLIRNVGERQGYHAPDDWQVGAFILNARDDELAHVLERALSYRYALPHKNSEEMKRYTPKKFKPESPKETTK